MIRPEKKMLVIMAHPDDESFGPAGTLALYSRQGVEIHLICVTNGEASEVILSNTEKLTMDERKQILAKTRQCEVRHAADIIGISQIDFLNYPDGQLCNALYHIIAHDLMTKIDSFSPHIIITAEPQGITGHLDHIAVSMITTYAFIKSGKGCKLYYFCLAKGMVSLESRENYFVYFPPGYEQSMITTRIDYHHFFDIKIAAMRQHLSQTTEVEYLIRKSEPLPKIDFYILQNHRNCQINLPEDDLFSGINIT